MSKQIERDGKSDAHYTEANGVFEAFYEANGWKIPQRLNTGGLSTADSPDEISNKVRLLQRLQYEAYVADAMSNYRVVTKQKARSALNANIGSTFGYAVLTPEEKKEIHVHLDKVREIVEESGLKDGKKNALFEALGELIKEVNRNGTRTDRLFAFASELGFSLNEFAHNARDAIKETNAVLRIVYDARAREEGIKLPSGQERPLLPDPDSFENNA